MDAKDTKASCKADGSEEKVEHDAQAGVIFHDESHSHEASGQSTALAIRALRRRMRKKKPKMIPRFALRLLRRQVQMRL